MLSMICGVTHANERSVADLMHMVGFSLQSHVTHSLCAMKCKQVRIIQIREW